MTHAQEQANVFADCLPRFETPPRGVSLDDEAKSGLEALHRIAALDESHINAPSAAVVDALAAGVHDVNFKVSQEAIKLLYSSRNRDAVVVASAKLLAATTDFLAHPPKFPVIQFGKEPKSPSAAEMDGQSHRWARCIVAMAIAPDVLINTGSLRDDRAVAALRAFVTSEINAKGSIHVAGPIALLDLGTRDAVRTVLDALDAFERARSWANAYKGRRPDPALGKVVHDRLVELAVKMGLAETPTWVPGATAKWRKWFEKNQASFPENLGTLSSVPGKSVGH
ncbi:MAG: hypothetical protein HYR85_08810 [Planctomycetes bacterium]|nr:hypothetical protein [Planctomycetota bacterium]MBI3847243.1 hypothetical protein [Planctomycetota bacterium]